MNKELKGIINKLSGNILGIGLDDDLIKVIKKNDKIT